MKRFFLLTVALVATLFAACDKDDTPQAIEFTGGTQSTQTFYADDTAKAGSVRFHATESWTAEVVETTRTTVDWLTLSRYSGEAGDCEITITLAENTTGNDRTAEIRITCAGTTTIITVTQRADKRPDAPQPPTPAAEKRISKITATDYHNSVVESYDFEYDVQNRLSAVKYNLTEVGSLRDVNDITFEYAANTIICKVLIHSGETGEETTVWTLDADGRIVSGKYEEIYFANSVQHKTTAEQYFEYDTAGCLTAFTQRWDATDSADNRLGWTDGNLTSFDFSRGGYTDNVAMTYSSYAAPKDLDINWLLYRAEATAAGFGCEMAFIQGLFGNTNKNLVATVAETTIETGNKNEYGYKYDYTFDNDYLTRVERRDSTNSELDTVWTIEYSR